MNKLMVLDTPWHYRKATYWDMPKCATCKYKLLDGTCYVLQQRVDSMFGLIPRDDFGCVHHSEIEQPTKAE